MLCCSVSHNAVVLQSVAACCSVVQNQYPCNIAVRLKILPANMSVSHCVRVLCMLVEGEGSVIRVCVYMLLVCLALTCTFQSIFFSKKSALYLPNFAPPIAMETSHSCVCIHHLTLLGADVYFS